MSDNPTGQSRVVMDASAAVAFVLKAEKHHGQAVALVSDLVKRDVTLCAPSIFVYECDSVIRRLVFTGALTPDQADEARKLISALGVDVIHDAAILDRAYQIAAERNQPRAYDAAYAAFAQARGLELWTDDERFYNAVSGALPFVKFIGHY
jgi:predicted nucleic acid-binding protein